MRPIDTERLKYIKQMLLGLSQGQVNLRFPRTKEDDIIEVIGMLLNKLTEEKRDYFSNITNQHRDPGISQFQHMLFILNHEFRIVYMTPHVFSVLGYSKNELLQQEFSQVLPEQHITTWQAIASSTIDTQADSNQKEIVFRTKSGMELSYCATISGLYDATTISQYLMIGVYEPIMNQRLLEEEFHRKIQAMPDTKSVSEKSPKVVLRQCDRHMLYEVRDYLLQNTDKPFPGLKGLALKFGTNEFKLKNGFKQMFDTSVYDFFKEERIIHCKNLLVDTDLPIKRIAEICGYSNSSHFSKEFKKKYGVVPREVR